MAKEVDEFFQNLQSQSQISPEMAALSHKNEVEGIDFERNIKLAFQKEDFGKHKRIKFEAQRKLLLCLMLFEVKKYMYEV